MRRSNELSSTNTVLCALHVSPYVYRKAALRSSSRSIAARVSWRCRWISDTASGEVVVTLAPVSWKTRCGEEPPTLWTSQRPPPDDLSTSPVVDRGKDPGERVPGLVKTVMSCQVSSGHRCEKNGKDQP